MKQFLLSSMTFIILINASLASDCLQVNENFSDFENILTSGPSKFVCSNLDLISGESMLGAGQSVLVDQENEVAQVLSVSGFPPFKETVIETLNISNNNGRPEGKFVSENNKTSFQITGEKSGVLIQKITIWGEEKVEAFNCHVQG